MNKFLSRKFILTIVITLLVSLLPLAYKAAGISDTVIMTVLGLIGGVGISYGIINVKDTKKDA